MGRKKSFRSFPLPLAFLFQPMLKRSADVVLRYSGVLWFYVIYDDNLSQVSVHHIINKILKLNSSPSQQARHFFFQGICFSSPKTTVWSRLGNPVFCFGVPNRCFGWGKANFLNKEIPCLLGRIGIQESLNYVTVERSNANSLNIKRFQLNQETVLCDLCKS